MSYDSFLQYSAETKVIERSPDHWWVTTKSNLYYCINKNWKVTRSLVSYDIAMIAKPMFSCIERSPDHWWVTTSEQTLAKVGFEDWKVTRSLVSYDNSTESLGAKLLIERSPDHWWVTTPYCSYNFCCTIERSPDHWWVTTAGLFSSLSENKNWKVTRSLVSYDSFLAVASISDSKLKGHQIIGELRPAIF